MKIDPYKNKQKYLNWKENSKDKIPGLSKENSDILMQYLEDMERGANIANGSVKGSRSYSRLNSLRSRFILFCNKFKELYDLDDLTKNIYVCKLKDLNTEWMLIK